MKVLIISRWNELYENHGSRKLQKLRAVQVTNSFESERYLELLQEKNAAVLLAAFVQMLQVASAATPRGALLRDNGKPHDAHSLATKTRAPVTWFKAAIPYLTANGNSHEPAWLLEIEVQSAAELALNPHLFLPESAARAADSPNKNATQSAEETAAERRQNGGNAPPSVVLGSVVLDSPPTGLGEEKNTGLRQNAADGMRGRESERTLPPNLDQSLFRKAWNDWVGHLQSKHRDRVSLSTLELHLEQCRKWGLAYAVMAIDHCIRSNFSRLELPSEKPALRAAGPVVDEATLTPTQRALRAGSWAHAARSQPAIPAA